MTEILAVLLDIPDTKQYSCPMQIKGIDFVCYIVKDLKEAKEFYTEKLGLTISQDGEQFVEFDTGNVTLCIGSADAVGEKIDTPQGNGQVGIAVDDVEKAVEELKAKGVHVEMDTQDFGQCKMAMIKDPTGNKICLHKRSDGTSG